MKISCRRFKKKKKKKRYQEFFFFEEILLYLLFYRQSLVDEDLLQKIFQKVKISC